MPDIEQIVVDRILAHHKDELERLDGVVEVRVRPALGEVERRGLGDAAQHPIVVMLVVKVSSNAAGRVRAWLEARREPPDHREPDGYR